MSMLGDPLDGMLADFCEASLGCPKIEVLRIAVKQLIIRDLKNNAGLRRRYEEARAARRGTLKLAVDNTLEKTP